MSDKKEDILEAALELFAEMGFHGTSVQMIVEKAKVGAGTVYRYFKDKEELVNVLYRHWKMQMYEAVNQDLPMDLPIRQLFHEIWRSQADFALDNRAAYSFLVAHHHSPYLDEESHALTERLHERYIYFFEMGREQQVIKDVAPQMLIAVVGGILSEMIKHYWAGWISLDPETVLAFEQICWEAIRR